VDGHAVLGDRELGPGELRQGPARPGGPHRPSRGAGPVPRRARGGEGMSSQGIAEAAGRVVEVVTARLAGVEVVARVERSEDHLTRFADSAIHQNVADDAWTASVTAHLDGRTLTLTSGLAGPDDGAAIDA